MRRKNRPLSLHARVRISSVSFFFLFLCGSLVPRVPLRRFARKRGRARTTAPPPSEVRAQMQRRYHPCAPVITRARCERVAGSEFELVMASRSNLIITAGTPPLRTQPANALSHSKFVKCLPRGEDYNAIEYAREELAALQKTRSQGKFTTRTNSIDAFRPRDALIRRVHATRRCWTARRS